MKSNTQNIVGRVADALARQRAVLDEMRGELPGIAEKLSESGEAVLAEAQARRAELLSTLSREYELLRREWNETEGISGAERARIEELAETVRGLVAEVEPALARAVQTITSQMTGIAASRGELRRGKSVMHAYKGRAPSEGGGLDRQG